MDDGCECVRVLFEITVHTSKIRGICFFSKYSEAASFVVMNYMLISLIFNGVIRFTAYRFIFIVSSQIGLVL